jgi:hypothetical protein
MAQQTTRRAPRTEKGGRRSRTTASKLSNREAEYFGRFVRDNGLSIVLAALFLVFIAGQAVAGWLNYNDEQREHQQPTVAFVEYLGTGAFGEAVFENWESEFLQMGLYVVLTAYLFQRGSAESKDPDAREEVDEDPALKRDMSDVPAPVRKGGVLLALYNHSLTIALFALFALSFAGHAVCGAREFNAEALEHGQSQISTLAYLGTSRFWFESFQNWQSEFLAILAIVVLSIWLREKGSPESKPVAASHSTTGA